MISALNVRSQLRSLLLLYTFQRTIRVATANGKIFNRRKTPILILIIINKLLACLTFVADYEMPRATHLRFKFKYPTYLHHITVKFHLYWFRKCSRKPKSLLYLLFCSWKKTKNKNCDKIFFDRKNNIFLESVSFACLLAKAKTVKASELRKIMNAKALRATESCD